MLTPRQNRGQAAAIVAGAILAYAGSFAATFQFDDRAVILDDGRLATVRAFLAAVPQMIRPLLKLTFLVDRHLYGDNPAGYHVLNLVLHCGTALTVLAILSLTVGRLREEQRRGVQWVPFCTALLFALHPIGTETVTYICGRATGLASFFALLSVYLALAASSPGTSRRRFFGCAAAAIASFIVALLSKEIAVVVPALLLLWRVVVGDARENRLAIRLHATFWIVACGAVALAAWHPRYVMLARASLETRPMGQNLLTQVHAVCYGLSLFVFPWRLNFDHDLRTYSSIVQAPIPVDVALLIALAVLGACSVRRWPLVSLGLGWFFICLLPTNSLIPRYDILSERNLYLPSIGVVLAVIALLAGVVYRCRGRWRRTAATAAVAACAASAVWLGVATVGRNRIYRDEVTFWADAAHKSPEKARPHANLGYALMKAGELDRAISEFRIALALEPDNIAASENLRRAWLARQRPQ